jgi:hypothetical protein
MAIKLHPAFAIHPGRWLRTEIVEPHKLNVTVTARSVISPVRDEP